jgi:hypothetical protein
MLINRVSDINDLMCNFAPEIQIKKGILQSKTLAKQYFMVTDT